MDYCGFKSPSQATLQYIQSAPTQSFESHTCTDHRALSKLRRRRSIGSMSADRMNKCTSIQADIKISVWSLQMSKIVLWLLYCKGINPVLLCLCVYIGTYRVRLPSHCVVDRNPIIDPIYLALLTSAVAPNGTKPEGGVGLPKSSCICMSSLIALRACCLDGSSHGRVSLLTVSAFCLESKG